MPVSPVRRRMTPDEFLRHASSAGPSELVRGEVRMMTPASGAHGVIAGRIFAALKAFVDARELGECFPDNTGFLLPGLGDTVRSPDAAFVRADRLPEQGIGPGWVPIAPDLVVEIVSPNESAAELEAELADYVAAGTQLIWIVDPASRTVAIRRPGAAQILRAESEALDGADVLPGLLLEIASLFARLAR